MQTQKILSYSEFWPFYLGEHKNRINKILHVVGMFAGVCVAWRLWGFLTGFSLVPALAVSYGFAWTGHFVFEKNRPATWKYPLWSLISEFRMVGSILIGRVRL
ncbi:MAG: DUF962 domain-containing protein [Deltaproteobacteria bacterium]|nr:DUF962 domain-containing protein [Deltaproteobacteria bacterium]MBI3294577.1 DUF962 domain-containing protein [Deltaproteobacteria bacterium]